MSTARYVPCLSSWITLLASGRCFDIKPTDTRVNEWYLAEIPWVFPQKTVRFEGSPGGISKPNAKNELQVSVGFMFYTTTNMLRFDKHDGIWPTRWNLTNMMRFDKHNEIWPDQHDGISPPTWWDLTIKMKFDMNLTR